jgi:hypothetical protein
MAGKNPGKPKVPLAKPKGAPAVAKGPATTGKAPAFPGAAMPFTKGGGRAKPKPKTPPKGK